LHRYPLVDCWAIGILAYECLVGRAPYGDADTLDEALELIRTCPVNFQTNNAAASREAQDFIMVGLYKLRIQFTRSLKAPGFNPS
jgi:hypothetical protein